MKPLEIFISRGHVCKNEMRSKRHISEAGLYMKTKSTEVFISRSYISNSKISSKQYISEAGLYLKDRQTEVFLSRSYIRNYTMTPKRCLCETELHAKVKPADILLSRVDIVDINAAPKRQTSEANIYMESLKPLARITAIEVSFQISNGCYLGGRGNNYKGYPEHMTYGEFRRRFDILLPRDDREKEPVLDEKQAVEKMVDHMELDKRSFKLGLSQIFFRSGSLAQLEDARDDKLNDTIIQFQARCRGYIGRKNLKKLKVQYVAIKCLQRNIRKYMAVKNWSWWKLFTKVLPVLDVHRTEEELKSKTSEVGTLRSKIDKLADEKKEFSEQNVKLQKKVQDLSATLSELQSSVNATNELLEQETAERINLEEEIEKLRAENEQLKQENERLATELLEAKVSQPIHNRSYEDTNEYDEEGESSEDETFYKVKYKSLTREVDHLRKKLADQAEDEIEDLMSQKKQLERQLAEAREDTEDLRRHFNNNKRKLGKLNDEMEDMKLILETSQSRNADLEKKQRKFDQEMNNLKNEIQQERAQKDKIQKEKDQVAAQKYSMESELSEREEDIDRLKRQVERLQAELEDVDQSGMSGGGDVLALKKDKRELELKLQDQEEELDEQAGKIQILEQAKLRLEMESQRNRQQFQKDLESKDDEIEQAKLDQQRKMRQLEEQIEEEYREKNEAVKVRRELERRVFELQSSVDEADRSSEKRLRKEVKRLRILYRDAKYALDNQVNQTVEKNQLKQLRNQLEDAEFAKHIALKSKKQMEADMEDLHKQIEEISRVKQEVDDRCFALSRDNAELLTKIEEDEDEMDEIMKKNKQLISQIATLQTELHEQKSTTQSLEDSKAELEEKIQHLSNKLAYYQETSIDKSALQRAESRIRELEMKLDLEETSRTRLEAQSGRLKNQMASVQDDRDSIINRESRIKQDIAKLERQIKEYKEEIENLRKQETEHKRKREEMESDRESREELLSITKTELSLANKRIRDLQDSLEREMMASSSEDDYYSEGESDDDLSSLSSPRSRQSSFHQEPRTTRSLDRKATSGHYERSNRLRRRLDALQDESNLKALNRSRGASIDDSY